MDPFIGQIVAFAFTFAPNGWALCNGQVLLITQYTALFALLGTTYGGNGTTTFALPDLRGKTLIGTGEGVNASNYVLGQITAGGETVTLAASRAHNNMPPSLAINYCIALEGNFPPRS